MAGVIVDKRWCWTADRSRLVLDGHPDAAFLAYPLGTELSEEEARRVGLLRTPPPPAAEPEAKAVTKPADKARSAPSNK